MNEIPKKIVVGPFTYRVEVGGHDFHRARGDTEQKNLMGCANAERQVIALKEGMPPDQTADTLLHETLHACIACVGQPLSQEDEEAFIGGVTSTLLLTLRQNPKLVAYLLAPSRAPSAAAHSPGE